MGKQLTKQDLFEVVNTIVDKSNQDLRKVIDSSNQELRGVIKSSNQELREAIKNSNQELRKVIDNSNQDILEAINDSFSEFEGKIATKFDSIDKRFDSIEQRMATKSDLAAMETRLVTKSYLDDKLSTLRGDLLEVIQKEDNKLGSLASKLANHKVLPVKKVREILAMEPFAKTL